MDDPPITGMGMLDLVDEVKRLRKHIATLEGALSDSTRRELLLDQRRATLEGERDQLVIHIAVRDTEEFVNRRQGNVSSAEVGVYEAMAYERARALLDTSHDQDNDTEAR